MCCVDRPSADAPRAAGAASGLGAFASLPGEPGFAGDPACGVLGSVALAAICALARSLRAALSCFERSGSTTSGSPPSRRHPLGVEPLRDLPDRQPLRPELPDLDGLDIPDIEP